MLTRHSVPEVGLWSCARLGVAIFGVTLLTGSATLAQRVERVVSGTVTDRHNEPLAGAIVQVHSENVLTVISYITDRNGQYVFKHLNADDDYDLFATYRGYRSKARRLSKFDSHMSKQFHLVIKMP